MAVPPWSFGVPDPALPLVSTEPCVISRHHISIHEFGDLGKVWKAFAEHDVDCRPSGWLAFPFLFTLFTHLSPHSPTALPHTPVFPVLFINTLRVLPPGPNSLLMLSFEKENKKQKQHRVLSESYSVNFFSTLLRINILLLLLLFEDYAAG